MRLTKTKSSECSDNKSKRKKQKKSNLRKRKRKLQQVELPALVAEIKKAHLVNNHLKKNKFRMIHNLVESVKHLMSH